MLRTLPRADEEHDDQAKLEHTSNEDDVARMRSLLG